MVWIDLKMRDQLDLKEYPIIILLQSPGPEKIKQVIQQIWEKPGTWPVVICSKDPRSSWDMLRKSIPMILAAGGVVRDRRGRTLFIRRMGWWDLPKGKIDPGESSKKAALREVQEEVGLECTIVKGLNPTYHVYPIKKKLVLKKTDWYLMFSASILPKLQKEEDITDYAWKSADQLPAMKSKVYPNLAVLIDELPGDARKGIRAGANHGQ